MRCGLRSLLVGLLLAGFPLPAAAGDDLAGQIGAVIHRPEYRQAHWGILVVDAETGETVYQHHPDELCTPASTTKLFSCSAALAALGPDFKFETPVYRRGRLVDGRLEGDLILVAQGDLTLGGRTGPDGHLAFKDHDHTYAGFLPDCELTDTDPLAGLKALAKQVGALGIRQVTGDVLVDDRLFPHERGSGTGPSELTPILVNDNVVDVLVTPASGAGEPARVQTRPENHFFQVDARVQTVPAGQKTEITVQPAGPQGFSVRGQIACKAAPALRIHAVDDPAAFARALFIEALGREGVAVGASALRPPQTPLPDRSAYGKLPRVAVFTSPPFSEAVKVTLKVSHNLYASTLPLLAASRKGNGTLAEGLRLQRGFLAGLGLEVGTISFASGAGGANADAVTPRAAVQLLRALARRPEFPAFYDGLPVLGVDGTLVDAAPKDSPARGRVRAKTGTLVWYDFMNERMLLRSKAMAGFLTTARGRRLAFALFVNDVPLPPAVTSAREGKALGRLCEILVQKGP
jgi:D-alanyl-D-alanine carboxypeptidase/D-alanyl-D-alanine-endopeptidase (penicillin-binding protein 4)